jgi:pimeloyl-ACP methyl ester carboxylesterase
MLAARHWTGGLKLQIGQAQLALTVSDGKVSPGEPSAAQGVVEYQGPEPVWAHVLAAVPPRFHNDLMANVMLDLGLSRRGDPVVHAQYYAAVMRAVELLRATGSQAPTADPSRRTTSAFDTAVGRYLHVELDGHDHRIYFEEAGQGIPLLLQHTAGCHGSQWRHLLEEPRITERFRLIAYDLPYHGKSLPPTSRSWWAHPSEYKARAMEGLMSPTSPLPFRKETSFVYASGWPPAFLGDLYYYLAEFDLRDTASEIDTSRVGVHILSGEYDYSGRTELGRAAHEAIPGSTFTEMVGLGHFPMAENPERFIEYLLPVLSRIHG